MVRKKQIDSGTFLWRGILEELGEDVAEVEA